MRYLKTFESFTNNYILDFIYDRISESEFISHLESINENWISDAYENIKWKVIEYVWTFLQEAKKIGFKIFEKVLTFFKWIWNKVKSFKEKHPILFKVITITLLVMIILILSACVAHAQATGQPLDEKQISLAIGVISDLQEHGKIKDYTTLDTNKAIAYLIKLRDAHGVIDSKDVNLFGQESVTLANKAITASEELVKDARAEGSNSATYKMCLDLLEKGEKFIQYSFEKTGSSETVKLGFK